MQNIKFAILTTLKLIFSTIFLDPLLDLSGVTHIHTTVGTLLCFSQGCSRCFGPWDEVQSDV